ncbi:MAG: menaquinone reductase multiheme cytochrome c subunit QrcA [Bilophila sp.]
MEDRQNNAPSHAEEGKRTKRSGAGFAPFLLGLVVALVFGWWIFPELMFSKQQQPVQFSHDTHLKDAALNCSDCHHLRADGTFSGLPETKDCAACHAQLLGTSKAERDYVNDYVRKDKEVTWNVYQKQPDNVYFNHAAHSLKNCNVCHEFTERELCGLCHLDVTATKNPPVFRENRLSGYSQSTMKMWQCEACHADPNHLGSTNANNACFVCHK